jgi:hypothetical protein
VGAVITAEWPELVELFAGIPPRAFRKLVATVARRGGRQVADGVNGRQWSLPLADRVLLVATYYRTNLTMRQMAPLFDIRPAAVHRIIDRLGPYLALALTRRRYDPDTVLIVDGTLVPTRDKRIAASSKNYRTSVNMQVMIHAATRLSSRSASQRQVTATTAPPGPNRRSTAPPTARQCWPMAATRGLLMPHRRKVGQRELLAWKERDNIAHRKVRAHIEHTFAAMKCWKILRDCRRRGRGVYWATTGIAHLHNLALTH